MKEVLKALFLTPEENKYIQKTQKTESFMDLVLRNENPSGFSKGKNNLPDEFLEFVK